MKLADLQGYNYDPYQKRVLGALANAGCSPWHLAGCWWFGQPWPPKLRHVDAPSQYPPKLVARAYHMSKALEPGHEANHAALLCSGLLWEQLFPMDFPKQGLTRACEVLQLLAVSDNDADWIRANVVDNASPIRGWTFNLMSVDCVRLANGES